MKITSNRKDDILRRKAEYEADYKRREEAHNREYHELLEAQNKVYAPVIEFLEDLFRKYNLLYPKIEVGPGRYGEDSLSVRINVNENQLHNESNSLTWSYNAYLNKGELVRETSSWSGMNAVTVDQIAQLEQSVKVLKDLASLDWNDLLDRRLPKYSDYMKTSDPKFDTNKTNFKRELMEAELDDIIGERKMIKVNPFSGSWYNGAVYIAIVKDSGSQYTIKEIPSYYVDRGEASKYFDSIDTHRVKKINIIPVEPLDIIEV